jgi:sulfonate transport system substrate-binding protein
MNPENDLALDARKRGFLKKTLGLAGGSALIGTLGAVASGSASAQGNPNTLRIGYQKYGTLVLLKARGTLEQRLAPLGVKVEWLEFPAGPQLLEGLNAGAVDIGTVGETPPIFAQAAGVDFVYIGNEPVAPRGEAIVVPKDSPIKTVADLAGKKIALNRGSNVHFLLVRALQKAGIKYTDIQPIYLTPADARAAFTQGSVDAWVIWDPFFSAIQTQAGARVLVDGTGLVSNLQFYLATRRFAEAQPKLVYALLDEIGKVDSWGVANESAVAQFLSPQVGLDVATLDLAVKRASYGVQPITEATLAYQQQIADVFAELKLIPKRLNVKDAQWKT